MADPIERIKELTENARVERAGIHELAVEEMPFYQVTAIYRLIEMLGSIALAEAEEECYDDESPEPEEDES